MMSFQKTCGLAAIGAGATYVIGFWVYFSIIGPAQYGSPSIPVEQHVQFLAENMDLMIVWNQIIYVLNAILMVLIVIGLHRRLAASGALGQTASAFGLIWAGLILATGMLTNIGIAQIVRLSAEDMDAAATLWRSVMVVSSGLGGGNEITGGMWIFLLSLAGLKTKALPLGVNLLGVLVGGAGIISTIPALSAATMVFGLGFIAWFFVVGMALIWLKPLKEAEAR
ncbi:DUF4386 domain-containing protein [Hyphobacterium sp.]|uniref:DUF4386 domain-containing protein n=1 Tax=Hyphobacterium sp. TaxID=2004662 RepID=UPI003B51AD66